jgi:hypothetical protein
VFPHAELAAVHLRAGLFLAPAAAAPRTNLRRFSLAASAVVAGLLAGRPWSDNPMPASLAPLRYPAWRTRWLGGRIVRPVACSPQRSALTRQSARSELRIIGSSAVMFRDFRVNFSWPEQDAWGLEKRAPRLAPRRRSPYSADDQLLSSVDCVLFATLRNFCKAVMATTLYFPIGCRNSITTGVYS